MIWPDTGLQWVQTSPNIPDRITTFAYVGTGLLDSAGVNNGSGFTKPFLLAGASGIEGTKLASRLNARNLPGVWFRPAAWSPMVGFWKDKELTGVELMIFDPRRFVAVRTAVEIFSLRFAILFPHAIDIASVSQIDRDFGAPTQIRQSLLAGKSPEEIIDRMVSGSRAIRRAARGSICSIKRQQIWSPLGVGRRSNGDAPRSAVVMRNVKSSRPVDRGDR